MHAQEVGIIREVKTGDRARETRPKAVGGLILYGLIVLFVGAIVFSIGYRLITVTLADSEEEAAVGEL